MKQTVYCSHVDTARQVTIMKSMHRIILLCAALSVPYGSLSGADALSDDSSDTMTCGSNFIAVGSTMDTVLQLCGEPSFREGNRWTYSNVPGSFVYMLTFGGGNVLSIHTRAAESE
jgi:hypothetical protein